MMRFRDRDQDSYSGYAVLILVLLAAEGIALHLWLGSRSPFWALGLGVFHVGAALLVFADWRKLARATGWTLAGDLLEVDLGWRARGVIPASAIAGVDPADERTRGWVRAHIAGMPELVLHLREPVEIAVFGRRRRARTLLLAPDDPEAFTSALRAAGSASSD